MDVRKETISACLAGDVEALERLASSQADIYTTPINGMPIVHHAASAGRLEVLKWLAARHAPLDALDERGGSAALEAAAAGRVKALEFLVECGVDPACPDDRGDTALHVAAGYGHIDVLTFLVERCGQAVNLRTKLGVTPLIYAAAKPRLDVVRWLVSRGADPRERSLDRGWSAVHAAAGCNHTDTVRWLVKHDSELLSYRTRGGKSPRQVAISQKCQATTLCLIDLEKLSARRRLIEERKERRRIEAEQERLERAKIDELARELARSDAKRKRRQRKKKSRNNSQVVEAAPAPTEPESEPVEVVAVPDTGAPPCAVISVPSSEEAKDESSTVCGEGSAWEVKLSRRGKRQQRRATAELEAVGVLVAGSKRPSLDNDQQRGMRWGPSPKRSPGRAQVRGDRQPLTPSSGSRGNIQQKAGNASPPRSAHGDGGSDASDEESRALRANAPPWSPNRRQWSSGTLALQQKRQEDRAREERRKSGSGRKRAGCRDATPPKGTVATPENEFNRMIKKLVHMDRGARLAACKRFAKQAAAFEDNRMAEAVQMELGWRREVKERLQSAIHDHDAPRLRDILAEIDAAEEQRTIHLQYFDQTDGTWMKQPGGGLLSPPPGVEWETPSSSVAQYLVESDGKGVIDKDPALSKLVRSARKQLKRLLRSPLDAYVAKDGRGGIIVRAHFCSEAAGASAHQASSARWTTGEMPSPEEFGSLLDRSLEVWELGGQRHVLLELSLDHTSAYIPTAASRGFRFHHTTETVVTLALAWHGSLRATLNAPDSSPCTPKSGISAPPTAIVRRLSDAALPAFASHYLEVGALIVKSTTTRSTATGSTDLLELQTELLLVLDLTVEPPLWVLPGGRLQQGEEAGDAAERLVAHATGLVVGCQSVCALLQRHDQEFGLTALHFVCAMRAVRSSELSAARGANKRSVRWTTVEKLLAGERVSALTKQVCRALSTAATGAVDAVQLLR